MGTSATQKNMDNFPEDYDSNTVQKGTAHMGRRAMNARMSWHKASQNNVSLLLASCLCNHLNSTKYMGNLKAIHLQVSWKHSYSNYLPSLLKQQTSTKYLALFSGKVW